jgi:hypothetical protein
MAPNFHFLGVKGLKDIMGLNVCFVNGISTNDKEGKSKIN